MLTRVICTILLWVLATWVTQAEEGYRFGACPWEIKIQLAGDFSPLKPIDIDLVTPSLLDRVVLRSEDELLQIAVGGLRVLDHLQGQVTINQVLALKEHPEFQARFPYVLELSTAVAFYRIQVVPGSLIQLDGIRFDQVGGCVLGTSFQLYGETAEARVESVLRGLSFRQTELHRE